VRFGKTTLKGTLIEAPITHQDIADSLNMVRETVSRTIEKLIAQNLIEQINHSFVLTDVVKLRAAVE
jgi:predicted transcriptional regulator